MFVTLFARLSELLRQLRGCGDVSARRPRLGRPRVPTQLLVQPRDQAGFRQRSKRLDHRHE